MRSLFQLLLVVVVAALSACSTATPETTTTNPAPLVDLELSVDGLGDVQFGIDPETVIADISARFGAPDHDSLWIASEPNIYGSCPGEMMRAIGWGSLVAIFIDDGETDLGGWFYTYTYGYDYSENAGGIDQRGLNLETDGGVGLGTTVAGLRAILGADLVISGDTDLDVWAFETGRFRGLLSGPDDDAVVTLIEPLLGCD